MIGIADDLRYVKGVDNNMTTKSASKPSLFAALAALTDEIQTEKLAAARKQAGPTPADPGGYQGPSAHPSTKVDNSAQEASEGARSSENTADIKADVPHAGVDSTPEATPNKDQQDSRQFNIGTQQSATGEDPSVEDDYKGYKDDPGSSHPATADSNPEKYGSASFEESYATSVTLGNSILADLANGFGRELQKRAEGASRALGSGHGDSDPSSPTPTANPDTSQDMKPVAGDKDGEHVEPGGGSDRAAKVAAARAGVQQSQQDVASQIEAGYELAALLGIDKAAAEAGVTETIATTIQDARFDADLYGSYHRTLYDQLHKQAIDDGASAGEDHSAPGDDESGAAEGGAPSEAGSMGGGGGLEALMGGGDPMGGDPMGGDPLGGDASEEEAIAALAAALDELGIPLEELAGVGGDPTGGAPAGGDPLGGGPPGAGMEVSAAASRRKLAAAVRNYKRSGRYEIKEARTDRERALRNYMKGHIRELLGL